MRHELRGMAAGIAVALVGMWAIGTVAAQVLGQPFYPADEPNRVVLYFSEPPKRFCESMVVLLPVPASPTAERFAGRPIEPGKTASLTTWICVPREQPKK